MNIAIQKLTKDFASKFATEIVAILDSIPKVKPHTVEQLLEDYKGDVYMEGKWEMSLCAIVDNSLVGVLIAYIKLPEVSTPYSTPSYYINSIAISKFYQGRGIGQKLLRTFIEQSSTADCAKWISVQTNSAPWNRQVVRFYEKAGFQIIGTKNYPDRVDHVFKYSDLSVDVQKQE